jgi:exodeoxyribonuclease VII large subunit
MRRGYPRAGLESVLTPTPIGAPVAPGTTRETAITIEDLNATARLLVEQSLGYFWIRGEVTDFKRHRNGHWYFSLRDSTSQIACVVWSTDQRGIPASPDDGMQVLAHAQLTVYAAKGSLQLRIVRLEGAGDGLWRKAMELTIERLRGEGLLSAERKRPLPLFPRCVAVVTSADGAALRDIVAVARRRRPGIQIIIACAAVQGDSAPREICRALGRVRRWRAADVIIVGRGGGGRDDLRAFNDENVARAVAECEVPVISAVGHEIDTTICDLVADVRAATPSAAAERAVPAVSDLLRNLTTRRTRLVAALAHRTSSATGDLRTASRELRVATARVIQSHRATIASGASRLDTLSPLSTLARGYAIARGASGETLTSVGDFHRGDRFDLLLHDGTVPARVDSGQATKEERAAG